MTCTARNALDELCTCEGLHSHCASCGMWMASTVALCTHHEMGVDDWALVNRLANDALMRGHWPKFDAGEPLPTEDSDAVSTAEIAY